MPPWTSRDRWSGTAWTSCAEGRALDVPVLVAMATSEGPEEAAGAQEIVANAPGGSALLTPDTGHGYVLLNDSDGAVLPLAADVLRWIKRHA